MRLAFIVFFLVITLIVASGHLYFYRRIVRDLKLSERRRRYGFWAMVGLFVLTIAGVSLSRLVLGSMLQGMVLAGMIWLGFAFYLLLFLGIFDFARVTRWLLRRLRTPNQKLIEAQQGQEVNASALDASRRRFVARLSAGTAIAASGAVTGIGIRNAWGDFDTPEIVTKLSRLPRQLDGFRIVQVSDIHIGPTLDRGFIARIVERVNALKPDCVVITGDLVDGSVAQIGDEVRGLGSIEARYGRYFSSGNHEFYSGVEEWLPFLERHNIRVLGNRRVAIDSGSAGFDLAGIHDYRATDTFAPDISSIMKGRDESRELVLLAHQPVQIDLAVQAGAGLQLSGHTHGGQVFPFGLLAAIPQPYLKGHYQHDANTQIYVNRGTGYWGPPLRVGNAPEITQIVLTAS